MFFPAETDIVATCIVIRDGVPRSVAICRVVRDGVPGAVATCRVIRDGVPEFVATCRVVRDGVPKSVATCRVVRDGVPDCVAACTISAPPVSMRKLGTSFFKTKREGGNFSEKLFYPQQIACICRNLRQIGSRIENDFCTIVFNNGIAFLIGLI